MSSQVDELNVELTDATDEIDVELSDSTDVFDVELVDNVVQVEGAKVYQDTTANWNAQRDLIAKENAIYVYTDYSNDKPGIKFGDGLTYLIDLPFATGSNNADMVEHLADTTIHITAHERESWNNKVTCFISQAQEETIVFTKGE